MNETTEHYDKGSASRRERGLVRRVYITAATQTRLKQLADHLGLSVHEALDRAVGAGLTLCNGDERANDS